VRIVALYIQYRDGVPDEDRRRLYQHARLSLPEQDAVNSLLHFGVRISRVRNISQFPSVYNVVLI
jgi:syntaxin-binding protein 1